jgi:hypothetical protein
MKKGFVVALLSMLVVPAVAVAEIEVPAIESVKTFARPNDSRFQYSLPDKNQIKQRREQKKAAKAAPTETKTDADEDEIWLDTSNLKTTKKVIKKINPDTNYDNSNVKLDDAPMNYDSFPKFYNQNDVTQQQFMPMIGY